MSHTSSFTSIFFLAFIATAMAQVVSNNKGVSVTVDPKHGIYIVTINGFYFGKSDGGPLAKEAISITESKLDNLKKNNDLSLNSEYTKCIQTVQDSFGELANAVTNDPSGGLVVPSDLVSWTKAAADGTDSCTLGILDAGLSPLLLASIMSDTASAANMATVAIDIVNKLST